jgi:hypothetical protein
MSREEVRKLIGGYATGSLTDAERKLLFDAALEDQELFEELAREQELKEMLEEPGAKQRLIAALEEPNRPARAWWARPWIWAAAATVAAGVVVTTVVRRSPERPTELAAVLETKPQSAPAPLPQPSSQIAETAKRKNAPKAADAANEVRLDALEDRKQAERQEVEKKREADQPAPAPAAAPPPPPVKELFASKDVQAGQAGQAAGSVGGAQQARRLTSEKANIAASIAKAARFGFDYAVQPDGRLRVTPFADGYLSFQGLPAQRAGAGIPVFFEPAGTDSVSVSFATTPVPPSKSAAVRDQRSGTVEDLNPSPDSRLEVVIRVKP